MLHSYVSLTTLCQSQAVSCRVASGPSSYITARLFPERTTIPQRSDCGPLPQSRCPHLLVWLPPALDVGSGRMDPRGLIIHAGTSWERGTTVALGMPVLSHTSLDDGTTQFVHETWIIFLQHSNFSLYFLPTHHFIRYRLFMTSNVAYCTSCETQVFVIFKNPRAHTHAYT